MIKKIPGNKAMQNFCLDEDFIDFQKADIISLNDILIFSSNP